NQDTSLAQVEAGSVDYDAGGHPGSEDARLWTTYGPDSDKAAAGKQQYFVNAQMGMNYFALNTSRDIFSKLKLRQAVNYAIDRAGLVASQGAYAGFATDQTLPPTMPGFTDGDIYPLDGPDLAKAKALIDEAG